jgi:hypothetical protein
MFEQSSRYYHIQDAKFTLASDKDSIEINYKRRRFLPQIDKMTVLQEAVIKAGDRLDILANVFTGDPEQYWRICDANDVMYPPELTNELGRILRIALPDII